MRRRGTLHAVLAVALVLTVILAAFPALRVTIADTVAAASVNQGGARASRVTPPLGKAASGAESAVALSTAQPSLSATSALSVTTTATTSATASASMSVSATASGTASVSATATPSATPSATASATGTSTAVGTTTATLSPSPTGTATAADSATPSPSDAAAGAAAYGQLPLSFEPNRGQVDPSVRYQARGPGYTVYLTANEAVLGLFPAATPLTGTARLPNGRLAPPPS